MPWREICPMEEKLRFVAAVLAGERRMTELCASFGISRKTGYKWLGRYVRQGPAGLYDLPRVCVEFQFRRQLGSEISLCNVAARNMTQVLRLVVGVRRSVEPA